MATIKSFTDIEQSKKLAKILPLDSADMYYGYGKNKPEFLPISDIDVKCLSLHCWSLAALLEVLPEYNLQKTDWGNKTECKIVVTIKEENYASKNYNNPVDACVDIVEKLNKLKLL